MTTALVGRLARFGGVGIVATLVHVLTALALEAQANLAPQAANLCGFLAAVLVSYFGHARFTFAVNPRSAGQFLRFFAVALTGLGASSGIVWLFTTQLGLGFATAMGVVAVVVPLITFVAAQLWVFTDRRTTTEGIAPVLIVAMAVPVAMLILSWNRAITDDVAWYLIATRDWLAGASLYVDIIEVNPPLNFYYTVPALLISDLFGISDTNGQYVFTAILIFGSLLWCGLILREDPGLSLRRRMVLLLGIGGALVIPALDSLGQREQTMVILMMPWLLGQITNRAPTARTEVPRALVAALGMCVKPHFVLFPMAVTLVRMAQSRSLWPILSPANLVFLVVGSAYVAFVWLVHPEYLFEIAPMAGLVYGAYRGSTEILVTAAYPKVLLLLLPVLVALRDRSENPRLDVFAAVTLAGLACYVAQGTGFHYHLIPMASFGIVAYLLILVRAKAIGPFVVAAAAAVIGLSTLAIRQGYPRHTAVDHLTSQFDRVGAFDSFISLSSSLFAGPPVAMAFDADWASRYPANWLVPGGIGGLRQTDCAAEPDRCAALTAIVVKNRADNIADMVARRPDLMIVDRHSPYFGTVRFDWLAFMAEDPAWAGVFSQYRQVAETERFLYFRRLP